MSDNYEKYDKYDFTKTAIIVRCKQKWKKRLPALELIVDDDVVGLIGPGQTETINVDPGQHSIRVGGPTSKIVLDVDLEEGGKAFVDFSPKMGMPLAIMAGGFSGGLILFMFAFPNVPIGQRLIPGLFIIMLLIFLLSKFRPFALQPYDPEQENFR